MNTSSDNIVVNSCQYTPVYVIENPGVSQPRSYIITPDEQPVPVQRPVSENLKRFYENSGKLGNNLSSSAECSTKARVIKKQEGNVIGNNLKLASFLMPKSESPKPQSNNSVVLKPVVVTNANTIVHPVPQLDINRKIVKIKDIPQITKSVNHGKVLPKIKPKEIPANLSKHTSVQLLKLGETYHSLNELSDDQMKIVNHALKIFSNPQKTQEPTYDPVTNTRFIYKVVSPKDLTVVGKNKVIFKQKKNEIKKETIKKIEKKEIKYVQEEQEEETCPVAETKVTRSGRKVKLPKNILPEETPQKPRKKCGTIVSCFQCSTEFSSLYRLQRHYENHPTHIPARIHSNLFHCLLAIIKGGSNEDSANIFVQQLEQLIAKLKSLLPCLLTRVDGIKQSTISDDVGRLFGMEAGKYSLNMEALTCVKNKDGYCRHNPQPTPQSNCTQLPNTNEGHTNEIVIDTDDCARINSAEKWPTVSKRMEGRKMKPENQDSTAKKMKLAKDSESQVDMRIEDIVAFLNSTEKMKLESESASVPLLDEDSSDFQVTIEDSTTDKISRPPHVQFHSAHFDIRSSPIKPSSTVFRKFKIDPDKIARYEPQIIRPPALAQDNETFSLQTPEVAIEDATDHLEPDELFRKDLTSKSHEIFRDDIILPKSHNLFTEDLTTPSKTQGLFREDLTTPCKTQGLFRTGLTTSSKSHELFREDMTISSKSDPLSFDTPKQWSIDQPEYLKPSTLIDEQNDTYKPSSLIEPALLHIKDPDDKTATNETNPNHEINDLRLLPNPSQSVLTFLDSLGNSVDFQLDLFS